MMNTKVSLGSVIIGDIDEKAHNLEPADVSIFMFAYEGNTVTIRNKQTNDVVATFKLFYQK